MPTAPLWGPARARVGSHNGAVVLPACKMLGRGRAVGSQAVALPVLADEVANGVYFIRLVMEKTVITQRLVISR